MKDCIECHEPLYQHEREFCDYCRGTSVKAREVPSAEFNTRKAPERDPRRRAYEAPLPPMPCIPDNDDR